MTVYYKDETLTLLLGDAVEQMRTLPDSSVNCVVTSSPYFGLRDYEDNPDQIGLESTPGEYVARLVAVFDQVRRVLADDGTLWLNLGDSYSGGNRTSYHADSATKAVRSRGHAEYRPITGIPEKNLLGIPWQVAFALQDAGWYLRNAIVWHKPNAMPESVRDRLSTRYELVFLLTRSPRYWFDLDSIREPAGDKAIARGRKWGDRKEAGEPVRYGLAGLAGVQSSDLAPNGKGRNPGDFWSIPTSPLPEAHFAAFPLELPRRCILAGCKPSGTVLDPFSGAGTTALAAQQLGRRAIGIDINAAYHDIALRRMTNAPLPFETGGVA